MTNEIKFQTKLVLFIAVLFFVTAIICYPFIFEKFLSFGNFVHQDRQSILQFSVGMMLISVILVLFRNKISSNILMVLFSLLFIIWIEISFRLFYVGFGSEDKKFMSASQSNATYLEFQAYEGNPFIHFTGQAGVSMVGSKALKIKGDYNNFGFVGNDFYYYKPANVIRVACLGESTTADGYPEVLEKFLNQSDKPNKYRFEVYNFGHAFWTTNHSVSNFALNVLDFSPDFVVIHHGWNEAKVRNVEANEFRGDYAHNFKVFDPPFVFDRYLIRASGLYRYFKFKFDQSPKWMTLSGSIENDAKQKIGNFDNQKELLPFERNLNSLVSLASANNIKVIFATIPYSTDSNIAMIDGKPNIIQCNNITRKVWRKYSDQVNLVDIDSSITNQRNDIFMDLAHVNDVGREIKAELIGRAILNNCDSAFYNNLKYVDKGYDSENGVTYYKQRMLTDSLWIQNDLLKKAKNQNVPLDSIILWDARYMIEMDKSGN